MKLSDLIFKIGALFNSWTEKRFFEQYIGFGFIDQEKFGRDRKSRLAYFDAKLAEKYRLLLGKSLAILRKEADPDMAEWADDLQAELSENLECFRRTGIMDPGLFLEMRDYLSSERSSERHECYREWICFIRARAFLDSLNRSAKAVS
ncbi:MAG TPA: hypothetical protein VHE10_00385 [Candidatus Paceibacterota bacterium]|nr:hypothetical protein [Candidatus Paceibacterota bacterium]